MGEMAVAPTGPTALTQFLLDRREINALVAVLAGSCQRIEQAAGRDTEVYTLLNSLRTLFSEAGYTYEHGEPPHPCRGCDQSFFLHPTATCENWY